MNTLATGKNERMLLLDLMRAVAVFMMIQGHTIDALLSHSFYNYDSPLFQLWQVGRGLTAPIFLFGSGFAYVIANTRKSVNGRMPVPLVIRRLRWIGLLFFIGALMHFPVWAVFDLGSVTLERWRVFWHVDVLRLIAVTLLGLLAIFLVARNVKQIFALSLGAMIVVVGASPWLNTIGLTGVLPEWLSSYLTFESGSYFPIFPFAGYLYAGAASAALFKMTRGETPMLTLVQRFAMAGAGTLAVTLLLRYEIFSNTGWVFASASPVFFAFRLSIVLLMWAVVGVALRKVERLPRLIPIIGQHTLFIYVFHVAALYGGIIGPGMSTIYGKELTLYPVFIIIATLVVVCSGMAYLLHDLKNYNLKAYRLVPYAGMVIFVILMFF